MIDLEQIRNNIFELEIMIHDLETENKSKKIILQELEKNVVIMKQDIHNIENELMSKKIMMLDHKNVIQDRLQLLNEDKLNKRKMGYSIRCQEYLLHHSECQYKFDDYIIDEIIEYSHKLHLLRCISLWAKEHYQNITCMPKNEKEFEKFEIVNSVNEKEIYISSIYRLHTYVLYNLYEFENAHCFDIDSHYEIISSLLYYHINHLLL